MIIPGKLYWVAGGMAVVALAITLWFRAHDARVRREAVAEAATAAIEAQIRAQDSVNIVLRDSLSSVQARTDTIRLTASASASNYQRARAQINTAAPQPPGVPAGSVVVPVVFVETADSLARMVPLLLATITAERAASERRIDALLRTDSLQRTEIEQLKIQVKAAGPGITGRLKWAGIGAAVAFGAITLLGNRN